MTNETIIEDLQLVPVPGWWQNPLVWLIAAALAVGAIYLWRRWLKSRPLPLKLPTQAPMGPPPHVEALNRLAELRAKHAELTAYQVALACSDILRRYIEARFALPIRYQTTREFLRAAQTNEELSADSRRELGTFLEFFDGLKFAQESAAPARTAQAIDAAEAFVRRCIPSEVAPAP